MLCIDNKETQDVRVLRVDADDKKLPEVLEFVDTLLEENNCSMKVQMQIDISLEELFVNIAHYAYPEGNGWAEIRAKIEDGSIVIALVDGGRPYDPLAKPDPDITLGVEDRQIGGLGIFISKKQMDEIKYSYTDGHNVLTMKKKIC
ncbi:MAG: ATP-binding protein [Clostridiales bacterium]|nr:ATP-binding protein [Clostridiales bacterium]